MGHLNQILSAIGKTPEGHATSAYKQIGNGVSTYVGEWVGIEMIRYMAQVSDKFSLIH